MPLLPQLIGGVEIRERRQRYAGEPRYKRLDFVRSRTTTNTDEWDLVKTTQKRYISVPVVYNVPVYQYPLVGYPPHQQPQLPYQYGWPQQQHHPQHQQLPHHEEHRDQIPIPPQHHGQQQLPYNDRRMIEAPPENYGIQDVTGHDSGDDIAYVEVRPKVRMPSTRRSSRGRSKSKKRRPRGDSIYSSDSSSDDDSYDSYRGSRSHRGRRHSRPRGRLAYDSDDSWADYNRRHARSRSRPPLLRGW